MYRNRPIIETLVRILGIQSSDIYSLPLPDLWRFDDVLWSPMGIGGGGGSTPPTTVEDQLSPLFQPSVGIAFPNASGTVLDNLLLIGM